VIASLIETAKLNGVEPHAYLADIMTRIVNGHPQARVQDLLSCAYGTATVKQAAREQRLRYSRAAI